MHKFAFLTEKTELSIKRTLYVGNASTLVNLSSHIGELVPLNTLRTSHFPRRSWSEWNDTSNQRLFLDALIKKLHITEDPERWGKITRRIVEQHGGDGILRSKYNGKLGRGKHMFRYTRLSSGQALVTLWPQYKQHCKNLLISIVHDMKLSKVEDVSQQYNLPWLAFTFPGC